MSRPTPYLFRMCVFLAAVVAVAAGLYAQVEHFFMANPALNGLILGALAIGILYIFRQALMLRPEVEWLENFRSGTVTSTQPRLLAPMAHMLGDRGRGGTGGVNGSRLTLSAIATRSLLDGVSARLDESREISRYLIGLMIFLGLLGTFWGLLQTVSTIGGVISGLKVGDGDAVAIFAHLQDGLAAPLAGMGTAFSASLFGLAGSLVLGFLELQAGQAQNRFYMDLEDWLAGSTRLGGGGLVEAGDQPVPAYIQALLETTAENMEKLQYTMAQGEDGRRSANSHLMALVERLSALSDQMKAEQQLMLRLAEGQMEMRPVLQRLADALGQGGANSGLDDASRAHLRNLDLHLARLVEETATGRVQSTQEIRTEIKILTRTIAALGEGAER
ncbi:MAG: flagellar motor protein MotA [Azospirillaceae bacterium]|nr:flagellar motor protein MotA [Azospirillaceae bacterium]